MRWSIPRAMLALVMMMATSVASLSGAQAQQPDFNATLEAAEQGNVVAQLELGLMYDQGLGVTQDYGKARTWYLKAAEQGLAAAQYNLGIMYIKGLGIAADSSVARVWLFRAAEQGFAEAQFNLAFMYILGMGGQKNLIEAYKWGTLSVEQNKKGAETVRDLAAKEMTPAQIAEAKRLVAEWNRKNASGGGAGSD